MVLFKSGATSAGRILKSWSKMSDFDRFMISHGYPSHNSGAALTRGNLISAGHGRWGSYSDHDVPLLTEHHAADVVHALGDGVPGPGHGDAPLSAARQSVASHLKKEGKVSDVC